MIRLDATPRKLQIVLSGAVTTNQLPVVVSYEDLIGATFTGATQVTTGATQVSNTNSGTAVDICDAPVSGRVRKVDYISVRNSDTVAATATIRYNQSGTSYTIVTVLMAVGDELEYTDGSGWKVTDSNGAIKTVLTALAVGAITGLGTGVATALGVNVGSAGAFVTFNGALGTPSSGTLTNATGLPIAGITGLGTGVGTALAVNVGSTGAFVVNGGALGSPSSVGTLPTLATNLLFTDATYDIGASGATRPRDFFLSRNAAIGGTLAVTGLSTLTAGWQVTGNTTPASGAGLETGHNGTIGHIYSYNRTTPAYMAMELDGLTLKLNQNSGGTITLNGAVTANSTLAVTSTISTGATSSTGTAVIIDGSNILRPLTSSERFKKVVQRDWHPSSSKASAFLALGPMLFDYRDAVEENAHETTFADGKLTLRAFKRGENLPGVKGVLGFSAEEADAAGLTELVNYRDGKPYSFRDHAIMAYQHAALRDHESRLVALEKRLH